MRKFIITLVVVGIVGGVAAAILWWRQPLQSGVDLVRQAFNREATVRFAVVGDNHGDNPVYRQILNEVADGDYEFLLNLGDNTEHGSTEEFGTVLAIEKTLTIPVYHTLGGHDIKTDPTLAAFRTAFKSVPNMVIAIGPATLILLDNADRKVGFSDETLTWLEAQLQADPDNTFLLAYHRPFGLPLANILGDDETAASRQSNERFQSIIAPHHIAQIFTAHLHTYLPYSLNGIPTVISGGGGDPAQSVLGGPKNNQFHYLEVVVTKNKTTITVHRLESIT